jgi:general stress protein 26
MPTPPELHEKLRWFREIIETIRVAMVTTSADDGALHSRPLTTLEVDAAGAVWFFTRASSSQAEDVQHTGRVNLSYVEPGGARFASVAGTAEIVRDVDKAASLWHSDYEEWFPGGADDADLAFIKVSVEKVEYWDSPLNPVAKLVEFVGSPSATIRISSVPAPPVSVSADAMNARASRS